MVHALWLHQPMCVRSVPIVISVCLACCTDPNYISESVPLGVAQTSEAHPAHHPHPPAPQESEAEAAEPEADAQDRGDCGLDYSGNWEIAISDSERGGGGGGCRAAPRARAQEAEVRQNPEEARRVQADLRDLRSQKRGRATQPTEQSFACVFEYGVLFSGASFHDVQPK